MREPDGYLPPIFPVSDYLYRCYSQLIRLQIEQGKILLEKVKKQKSYPALQPNVKNRGYHIRLTNKETYQLSRLTVAYLLLVSLKNNFR